MTGFDLTDTLSSALWLAGRGFAVHPLDHPALERCAGVRTREHDPATCSQRGKHPCTKWSQTATTDPEVIVSWFAGAARNVAVACKPSGLLVVDEDTPGGFQRFVESIGQVIPATFTVRTGKGRHYYFTAPGDVVLGNDRGALKGFGCDVRGGSGDGGYVVAPGSVHASGVLYEPDDPEATAVMAPSWLVDSLRQTAPAAAGDMSRWDDKPRGLDAVPEVIRGPRVGGGGERDGVLYSYACSLRARDVPMAEAQQLMRTVWERCEQPPACTEALPWEVALAKLTRAYEEHLPNRPRLVGAEVTVLEEVDLAPTLTDELASNPRLRAVVVDLQDRRRAREIVAEIEERKHPKPGPDCGTLAEILNRPPSERWRVEGLLPAGGRLLWSAQRKTGKTTAVGNLARSLLTGEPFLGRFECTKLDGRVIVLNYEVTGETFARWMDDIGVPSERMYVVNLRGRRNLLADEAGRTELVELIRAQEGEVLTVDPFGRSFTGKSQNDTAEVTPWLGRLDEVTEQAGCAELVLTAHAGWDGERTRGSSALEDWPDSIVTMTRDPDTDQRFLRAEGRDVEVEEDRLDYDKATRRLSLSGAGNRKQVRATEHIEHLAEAVRDLVYAEPGINTAALTTALRDAGEHLQREDTAAAVHAASARGWVHRERGKRNAWEHFPGQSSRVFPESSRGGVESSPDPSYRDGTTRRTTQTPSSPGTPDLLDALVDRCSRCGEGLDSSWHTECLRVGVPS